MPWWTFVDWATEWPVGRPPGGRDGHSDDDHACSSSTPCSARPSWRRPSACRAEAARYRAPRREAARGGAGEGLGPDRGLFRDAPEAKLYSQQTNVMAILVDAVPAAEQRALMERVLDGSPRSSQSTYYFSFYLLEALRKAGLADRYIEQLAPWRAMLAMGLTTTPESPEPTRSDSHAWSAHPNYGLLATVLGVRPATPGLPVGAHRAQPRSAEARRGPHAASPRRHRGPSGAIGRPGPARRGHAAPGPRRRLRVERPDGAVAGWPATDQPLSAASKGRRQGLCGTAEGVLKTRTPCCW